MYDDSWDACWVKLTDPHKEKKQRRGEEGCERANLYSRKKKRTKLVSLGHGDALRTSQLVRDSHFLTRRRPSVDTLHHHAPLLHLLLHLGRVQLETTLRRMYMMNKAVRDPCQRPSLSRRGGTRRRRRGRSRRRSTTTPSSSSTTSAVALNAVGRLRSAFGVPRRRVVDVVARQRTTRAAAARRVSSIAPRLTSCSTTNKQTHHHHQQPTQPKTFSKKNTLPRQKLQATIFDPYPFCLPFVEAADDVRRRDCAEAEADGGGGCISA